MATERPSKGKNSADTFKILVATDCHLGYEVKKTKRVQSNDSLTTFEEILKLGVEKNVDFMLLGGDLFHDARPPQRIIKECLSLLKKYCLGQRKIPFEFISTPPDSFPNKLVNFEDENMNVSMPIFSIHGNHDDPSYDSTGTMDILAATGLVNYFGDWRNLQEITVTPMIFQKGNSLVAIYGIGYVHEQRLSRMLRESKVHFVQPKNIEEITSILVIHQNRAKHAENEYIEENRFPSWFDVIIWGHEHECRVVPEFATTREDDGHYFICQPGSSVATSLAEGEAVPKHVGILHARHGKFRIEPVKLQTVRPFIFQDIYLSEAIEKGFCDFSPDGITEYIDDYIENTLFPAAEKLRSGHKNQPQLPLLRLRLFFTQDQQQVDLNHLHTKYIEKVANPNDIIVWKKHKAGSKRTKNDHFEDLTEEIAECFKRNADDPDAWTRTVQSGITKYFERNDYGLKVLSLPGINEAVHRCIVFGDDDAFAQVVDHQIRKSTDYLMGKSVDANSDAVLETLRKYRTERQTADGDAELRELQDLLNDPAKRSELTEDGVDDASDSGTVRGRGRGRGSRGGGRARGTGATARGTTKPTTKATTRGRGGRGRGMTPLDVSFVSDVSPDKEETPTTAFLKRFAAPPSQRNNTSRSNAPKSQRAAFVVDSDESD